MGDDGERKGGEKLPEWSCGSARVGAPPKMRAVCDEARECTGTDREPPGEC